MQLKTATQETRKFHTWKSFIIPQFLQQDHNKGGKVRGTVRFFGPNNRRSCAMFILYISV